MKISAQINIGGKKLVLYHLDDQKVHQKVHQKEAQNGLVGFAFIEIVNNVNWKTEDQKEDIEFKELNLINLVD